MIPIDPSTLLVFAAVSLVLNLTPGPDMVYALGRRVSSGPSAGYAAALGNLLGTLVHIGAAALGLAAFLAASGDAFTTLRLIGGAVLVVLGARAILGASAEPITQPVGGARSLTRVVAESFAIHTLNPKVAVFFMAFLPQFVDPTLGSPSTQMVVLGLWFAVQAALVICILTATAGVLTDRIGRNPSFPRLARRLSGGVLILFGLRLATSTSH